MKIRRWSNPKPEEIAESLEGFLSQLEGPTAIYLHGRQGGAKRAVVTLLQGNEPSGAKACHRLLREGEQPLFDTLLLIVSVNTAQQDPIFTHRHLAHERDLNRCFQAPFNQDDQGMLAESLLALLEEFKSDCVVDIHNSSGGGPSFAVTTALENEHLALSSLFTQRLVVTDLRLGSLMECSSANLPIVTIQCGGAQESKADSVAYKGLQRYLTQPTVTQLACQEAGLEIFTTPVRVELKSGFTLSYGQAVPLGIDIVLDEEIERFNFQIIDEQGVLGHVGERGLEALTAVNAEGKEIVHELLQVNEGKLQPAKPLKLFMATTQAAVAKSDCLFYAVCAKPLESM